MDCGENEYRNPQFELTYLHGDAGIERTVLFSNEAAAEAYCRKWNIQDHQIEYWGY